MSSTARRYQFVAAGLLGWVGLALACAPLADELPEEEAGPLVIETVETRIAGRPPGLLAFADGFESLSGGFNDLFSEDGVRWTSTQQDNPGSGENVIEIVADTVLTGQYALHTIANPSDETHSRVAVQKDGFRIYDGDRVSISFALYVPKSVDLEGVTLLDLECNSCWDQASGLPNTSPGIRLAVAGNFFVINRDKLLQPNLSNTALQIPRNQWMNIRLVLGISSSENGTMELYVDSDEIMRGTGNTLPNVELFRQKAAESEATFNLNEPLFFERMQLGVTGNAGNLVSVYFDDVTVVVQTGGGGSNTGNGPNDEACGAIFCP